MGCDIHVNIGKWDGEKAEELFCEETYWQQRHPNGTEDFWKKSRLMIGRNYHRFATLSGVRGEGPEPNGWPEWARVLWPDEYTACDYHSYTCLPIKEAAQIWLDTEYTDATNGQHGEIYGLCKANPVSMYFKIDSERPDIDQIYVCIFYDN